MTLILGSLLAALLAPAAAEVAVVDGRAHIGCAPLPMGGVGSTVVGGGTLTVAGTERRRVLALGTQRVALGGDVASVTIRAACRATAADYVLLAVSTAASACPVQYQVVEARDGAPLRIGRRFGACVDGATAALSGDGLVVTMPAGPGRDGNVTYRYAAGRVAATSAAPPPPPPVVATMSRRGRSPTVVAWQAPPACAAIARAQPGAPADAYLAELRRTWPTDWQSRGRISDQVFGNAQLRGIVTDLACLSALPGGETEVVETARPLFSSRRHGKAAFEQLDEVARGSTIDPAIRSAARQFHAQMRYRVDEVRLR